MRTAEYITAVRALTKTGSDYAVAKLLGITEQAVNGYRTGRHTMSPTVCILVAERLNLPPLQVIADAQAEAARDPSTRARWHRLRKSVAQKAATVLLALLAAMTPQTGETTTGASMKSSAFGATPIDGDGRGIQIMRHFAAALGRLWRRYRAAPLGAAQLPA